MAALVMQTQLDLDLTAALGRSAWASVTTSQMLTTRATSIASWCVLATQAAGIMVANVAMHLIRIALKAQDVSGINFVRGTRVSAPILPAAARPHLSFESRIFYRHFLKRVARFVLLQRLWSE